MVGATDDGYRKIIEGEKEILSKRGLQGQVEGAEDVVWREDVS